MNAEEIKWVRPGQLFQLWSGNKRGIVAILSKEERHIQALRVHDGSFLMLVRMPEDLQANENAKWLAEAAKELEMGGDAGDFYEFLLEETLIMLNRRQLTQLSEAY